MLLCELDGRVGMQFGVLVGAALQLDGRVLGGMGGMQFGVLVDAALRA